VSRQLTDRPFASNLSRYSTEKDEAVDSKMRDVEFWRAQQQALATEMFDNNEKAVAEEMREKFSKQRLALVSDTAYIGMFIFCFLWSISDNPFVSVSYSFGALMGMAYAYGLGKSVESFGGSFDDAATSRGAGVGEARFAFLILLVIFVGKFRAEGLKEIPAISGFFTYQIASVFQGFREFND